MTVIQEIHAQYIEINTKYGIEEFNSRAKNHHRIEKQWARKRELNDHAYFLFVFTRFEDHIRDQSSKLITKKQVKIVDWKKKAVWDNLPKEKNSDKLPLLKRAALLIDKGSHHYAKIDKYYEQRNKLAHGGNFTIPISMPTVFSDITDLINRLKI